MPDRNADFSGSIPANYDRYLGPVLFRPYAEDLAARLEIGGEASVLELACGTGILTQILRNRLPATVQLLATDLNEPMLEHARAKFGPNERIEWRQADAMDLSFGEATFDAVICQFGLMFVPDKRACVRQVYRVLKPGGTFLFNTWDAMQQNELAHIAHETIGSFFDRNPPTFYQVPCGYHDRAQIEKLLDDEGFGNIGISVVAKNSQITDAKATATGLIEGNPVVLEIAERDPDLVPKITRALTEAIRKRFTEASASARMRAVIVQARK